MLTPFLKMHGAGNDFVVFDAREKPLRLSSVQAKKLSDRNFGIGCDQLVIIEASGQADCFMRIFNADGGEVSTCGNATRCVAWVLNSSGAGSKKSYAIETAAGIVHAEIIADRSVRVDMGAPKLDWQDIPLTEARDTLHLAIGVGAAQDPVGVSMGNPHAVFFLEHATDELVHGAGPVLEHHSLFPSRANISFATVLSPDHISLRVWERGAGETLACGSGACATLVAAVRRGLTGRKATVSLKGGDLQIEWLPNSGKTEGSVLMTGPVETVFDGSVEI